MDSLEIASSVGQWDTLEPLVAGWASRFVVSGVFHKLGKPPVRNVEVFCDAPSSRLLESA